MSALQTTIGYTPPAAIDNADTINAVRARNLSRMGLLRTQGYNLYKSAGPTANSTFHNTWALDADFDLIRLVWQNYLLTPWSIDAASIAASANLGNGYDPTLVSGAANTFTPLTFNDAGLFQDFPSASGSATTLTVPASADGVLPATVCSDWVQIGSLPRQDIAGEKPLIMGRVFSSGTMNLNQGGNPDDFDGTWTAQSQGRTIRTYHKSASGNLTLTGFTAPSGPSYWFAFSAVQTITRNPGASVMGVGDSLQQGHILDSNQHYSPLHYATAALTSLTRPVSFINAARSGSSSDIFHARAKSYLNLFKPDIVVITTWTPNDLRTQAGADLCFARAMALVDLVRRAGAVPILSTAVPFDLDTSDDALRRGNNARARAAASSGTILLADYAAAVTDGGTPARLLAPYKASSGSHMSAAGYAACGAALAPAIALALV